MESIHLAKDLGQVQQNIISYLALHESQHQLHLDETFSYFFSRCPSFIRVIKPSGIIAE